MTSCSFLFRSLLKGSERFRPHLIEMGPKASDALRIQPVEPTGSILDIGHKACILQHFQVL